MPDDWKSGAARARRSLEGLSLGDAFGQLFFHRSPAEETIASLPDGPWPWTDDTHMALSIVDVLERHGSIEQDALAGAFARRFSDDPHRGYAGGARVLLERIGRGADWRSAAVALFDGGSYGNGGAMRAAPIGAYFAGDPGRAAAEAAKSAAVTHAHPEGQAGAIAVAAAAAIAALPDHPTGEQFLTTVLSFVPDGLTAAGIRKSLAIAPDGLSEAARALGTGYRVSAQDTVPFCLWSAAYHLDDFEAAVWWTVRGHGDCDTTCAIVGGIVAMSATALPGWVSRREDLP